MKSSVSGAKAAPATVINRNPYAKSAASFAVPESLRVNLVDHTERSRDFHLVGLS
jgi:hypothetical protein